MQAIEEGLLMTVHEYSGADPDGLIKCTCTIKGLRPPKLGGYEKDNPNSLKVKKLLTIQIIKHIEEYAVSRFICGGALGVDLIALNILYNLKKTSYPNLHIILALPHAGFTDRCWYKANTEETKMDEEHSDEVIHVDTIEGYISNKDAAATGIHLTEKLIKTNQYRVDNSAYLLAVWDGSNGGTGGCIDYFKSKKAEGRMLTVIDFAKNTVEVSYN